MRTPSKCNQIRSDNIAKAFTSVAMFNEIAGQFDNPSYTSVDLQLSLIFEELSETISALENQDPQELLDGAVDTMVTVFGLLQKLQALGYDVETAIRRVCENNLSKYPPQKPDSKLMMPTFTSEFNNKYGVWVVKDSNGKVRKPPNYLPVDLWGCFPEHANFEE